MNVNSLVEAPEEKTVDREKVCSLFFRNLISSDYHKRDKREKPISKSHRSL